MSRSRLVAASTDSSGAGVGQHVRGQAHLSQKVLEHRAVARHDVQ